MTQTHSGSSRRPPGPIEVDGYSLLARIGEGGMGVVHLARRGDGPRVALKVLRPHIIGDDEARSRLEREVSSLERVRSPWVAEIIDADPWGEVPYVATRFVPGLCLAEYVDEEGPITGQELRHFALGLAEGIASVHGVGVVHRDVKPANVILEGRRPILIDFGLARVADDLRITQTGWLLGTPGYLAPEVLLGHDATTATDVHSWAATVAFAGTGRPPFGRGPTVAIMDRVRRGEHNLDGLEPGMRRILELALAPDPEHRPSFAELAALLSRPADSPMAASAGEENFPMTMPIAARQPEQRKVTRPYTQVMPPAVSAPPAPPAAPLPPSPPPPVPVPHPHAASPHEAFGAPPLQALDARPAASQPSGTRSRQFVLGVLILAVAVAAIAAAPYLAAGGLIVSAWLMRSVGRASAAVRERRWMRGHRWYDPLQALLASPLHVVAAVPGTLALAAWASGMALAGGLVGYAAAWPLPRTLLLIGVAFAVGLWIGPGSGRVRGATRQLTQPLSRRWGTWIPVMAVLAVALVAAASAATDGADWSPAQGRPFAQLLP